MLGLERVAWGEEKEIPRKVEIEEVKDHREDYETNIIV
jgi:hypothetical protein